MDDEVVLGSDREVWLCFYLLFKFGEQFSHFSSEDEWSQTVKRCCISMYTFVSRSSMLLIMGMLKKDWNGSKLVAARDCLRTQLLWFLRNNFLISICVDCKLCWTWTWACWRSIEMVHIYVLWNSLIAGYAEYGPFDVFKCIQQMNLEEIIPKVIKNFDAWKHVEE